MNQNDFPQYNPHTDPNNPINEVVLLQYPDFVASKCKPGQDILEALTPEKCHLWHMASCIPGEAGELFDQVKKFLIYNKPFTHEQMRETTKEIGDILFYLQGLINGLNATFGSSLDLMFILEENIQKLNARYKTGYSDKEAQTRADVTISDPITEND